ncbi:protein kinase domain-containing protein [Pirellulimonas nuda]|uniref:protein kinase domain-containing protein n=1 Tax=Pirellulimonas nuda TaxID=2528009 RepID=UPI00119D4DB3|nr:protein kinase [Pirellulimonas nuda]
MTLAPADPASLRSFPSPQAAGIERLRDLRRISSGPDGVAYDALLDADGRRVELRRLLGPARSDPRRQALAQRLRLIELLGLPAVRRVVLSCLEGEAPAVALEAAGQTPLTASTDDGRRLLGVLVEAASCVDAAHHLGLYGVDLRPEAITLRDGVPRLDFSGLAVDALRGLETDTPRAPAPTQAGAGDDPRLADLRSLAGLIAWALQQPAVAAYCQDRSHRETARLNQLCSAASGTISDPPAASRFARCLEALLADDPPPRVASAGGASEIAVTPLAADGTAEVANLAPPSQAPRGREPQVGDRLGRFRIEAKLGEGGMGAVYRAADLASGEPVAVKVLSQRAMLRGNALQRFQKEARLLASVNNPHVTNLIEVNDEDGLHYLVLEFVDGVDVRCLLDHRGADRGADRGGGPLREAAALSIAADVARALVDAHQRDIIHRDIKPDNILLVGARADHADELPTPRAKLTDFGIARHVDQSESLALTMAGGMIGTPVYMAPEQCRGGGDAGPPADVYALGVTLFEMLTGRTPFESDDPMKLVGMHCFEPAPAVRRLNPLVSEAAEQLVAKCLQKHAGDRFADAAHLLRELDAMQRGEPSTVAVRPLLPGHDPTRVLSNQMTWELRSPPERVWPYVSNTERLNRAIGLPPVEYRVERDPQGAVRRWATVRLAGMAMSWEEHPFEWVEGRRMSVLREFTGGPFQWFVSTVELERTPEGGSVLRHEVRILPRNALGRWIAKVETGAKCRRSLDKVYTRIDQTLAGQQENKSDAFEAPAKLDRGRLDRLARRAAALAAQGVESSLVDRLSQHLAEAPAQEVAQIRPVALADKLGLDEGAVIDACLLGAAQGLLRMEWDVLCPTCRVAADSKQALKQLSAHTHCEACDADFRSDLAGAVELVFRVHPEIRNTSVGRYCVGGPWHAPHVVAQLRLEPGERLELELELPAGDYLLRGPRLPGAVPLRVQPSGAPSQHEFALEAAADPKRTVALRAGKQLLTLDNRYDVQQIVRIEKTIPRGDVLTAARAAALPRFRELFPGEVLDSGNTISAEQVSLLTTAIPEVDHLYARHGDAQGYAVVERHLRVLESTIRAGRGEVVKVVGEGVMAAFDDVGDAVRSALAIDAALAADPITSNLALAIGVHRGPAIVTTSNDRLDYFGAVARQALALPTAAGVGVTLTEPVAADPLVDALLARLTCVGETLTLALPGRPAQLAQHFSIDTRVPDDC